MMTPLLIDALTISEGRFEKPCPALVLKMMLLNGEISSEFSEKIKNQALLLLAIYRKLLLALETDLRNVKDLKNSVKRRHWGKVDKVQDKMVVADQLRLKRLDPEEMILFLNTQHYLNKLPISFVKKTGRLGSTSGEWYFFNRKCFSRLYLPKAFTIRKN